jgi:hypothetical protein
MKDSAVQSIVEAAFLGMPTGLLASQMTEQAFRLADAGLGGQASLDSTQQTVRSMFADSLRAIQLRHQALSSAAPTLPNLTVAATYLTETAFDMASSVRGRLRPEDQAKSIVTQCVETAISELAA